MSSFSDTEYFAILSIMPLEVVIMVVLVVLLVVVMVVVMVVVVVAVGVKMMNLVRVIKKG